MQKRILILLSICSIAYAKNALVEETVTVDNPNPTPTSTQTITAQKADNTQLTPDEAFLAKNKNLPGVVTLDDGLQYKVLQEGNGPQPSNFDSVTVHYSGKLIDGTEFDSSYKRGEPTTFSVMDVIPGWTEALKLMKQGSVWELYIPAYLGYGQNGAPPLIGPNKTLIFKVNLISVNKAA